MVPTPQVSRALTVRGFAKFGTLVCGGHKNKPRLASAKEKLPSPVTGVFASYCGFRYGWVQGCSIQRIKHLSVFPSPPFSRFSRFLWWCDAHHSFSPYVFTVPKTEGTLSVLPVFSGKVYSYAPLPTFPSHSGRLILPSLGMDYMPTSQAGIGIRHVQILKRNVGVLLP